MAVTGVFAADFSSFFDAVEQSDAKLQRLASNATRTGDALARTGGSFDGDPVANEINKVAAAAQNADDKLDDLGTSGSSSVQQLTSTVKGAIDAFLAFQAVDIAVGFVTGIADTAGALSDLSAQTRISVEDLQIMQSALKDFGVSSDEMGRALFKLSNNIAKGDDSVSSALRQMGLSLDDVRNKQGVELFTTIQDGLAGLNGELRDTTAVTLYGEKLGMVMAGAAEGAHDAIDAARALNDVMDAETVAAFDASSEAIDKMNNHLTVMIANMLGPVASGFNTLADAVNKGASGWDIAGAMIKDFWAEWGSGTPTVENLTRVLDQNNQKFAEHVAALKTVTAAHEEFIGPTQSAADAAKALAAQHKAEADAARDAAAADRERLKQLQASAALEQKIIQENAAFKKQAVKDDEQARAAAAKVEQEQAAADARKVAALAAEQAAMDAEVESLQRVSDASTAAGNAGAAAGEQTAAGFTQATQQINISADAIREWQNLMAFTNAANAILSTNSMFTTRSQLEQIANINGDPRFGPTVPRGTSPVGGGQNITVNNEFNLSDTESALAQRISDQIMRTIRSGTQLGTT